MAIGVPQTSISPEPGARFNTSGAQGLASIQGDQAAALGQATSSLGSTIGQIVIDKQNEANQLRVDDAINRLKEEQLRLTFDPKTGFRTQKGLAALERPGGQSLTAEYTGLLDTSATGIAAGLGNEPQRAAFARAAASLRGQFQSDATQHETREFTDWSVSVRDGTIGIRINELGTRWNDPGFDRAEAIGSIKAAVADKGRILGWSASEVEVRTLALTSAGHKTALLAALEAGNVGYADTYLQQYSSQMTGDDLLSVRGQITKELDATVALTAVEDAYTTAQPALDPSTRGRAFNVAVGTESNGQQFDTNGRPLTSPAGALGAAQVLPRTGPEAARLAGEKWDPQRLKSDRAYNLRLGEAYFNSQIQTFGGDVRKAWAAYNAGPGWVKAAQARAALAAPGTNGADWFWQLNHDGRTAANRKQTEDYVTGNWAKFSRGGGAPKRPSLDDVLAGLRTDPRIAAHPDRLRLAEQEATRRWTTAAAERDQRSDEAREAALRFLDATPTATMATLSPSTRAALDPDDYDTVNAYAARKAAGGTTTTNQALYAALTVPGVLAGMSEAKFYALRTQLSPGDWESFAKERVAQRGNPQAPPGALSDALTGKLAVTGLALPPKPTPEDKARVAGLTRLARESVLREQADLGRQLTPEELRKHLDRLFASTITYHTPGGKTVEVSAVSGGFDDIPSNTAKLIRKKMEKLAGRDVSDQEVLEAWRMAKLRGQ